MHCHQAALSLILHRLDVQKHVLQGKGKLKLIFSSWSGSFRGTLWSALPAISCYSICFRSAFLSAFFSSTWNQFWDMFKPSSLSKPLRDWTIKSFGLVLNFEMNEKYLRAPWQSLGTWIWICRKSIERLAKRLWLELSMKYDNYSQTSLLK